MNKESIYRLTMDQLIEWLLEYGHKKFRAMQVWDFLYRKKVTDFSDMVDVHPECIQLLADHFVIQSLEEHCRQESTDVTVKPYS